MTRSRTLAVAAFLASGAPAGARTANSIQYPAGYASGISICIRQTDGTCAPASTNAPLPAAAKQEAVALASANLQAGASTVYVGSYIVSQACTSYNAGSLNARYRGPDGATMVSLLTQSHERQRGRDLVSLGSNAVVDATLPTGSAGCNVMLARVP